MEKIEGAVLFVKTSFMAYPFLFRLLCISLSLLFLAFLHPLLAAFIFAEIYIQVKLLPSSLCKRSTVSPCPCNGFIISIIIYNFKTYERVNS